MDEIIYTSLADNKSELDRIELWRYPLNYSIKSFTKKGKVKEYTIVPLSNPLPDVIRACDERAR